jgi:hypothetical protein
VKTALVEQGEVVVWAYLTKMATTSNGELILQGFSTRTIFRMPQTYPQSGPLEAGIWTDHPLCIKSIMMSNYNMKMMMQEHKIVDEVVSEQYHGCALDVTYKINTEEMKQTVWGILCCTYSFIAQSLSPKSSSMTSSVEAPFTSSVEAPFTSSVETPFMSSVEAPFTSSSTTYAQVAGTLQSDEVFGFPKAYEEAPKNEIPMVLTMPNLSERMTMLNLTKDMITPLPANEKRSSTTYDMEKVVTLTDKEGTVNIYRVSDFDIRDYAATCQRTSRFNNEWRNAAITHSEAEYIERFKEHLADGEAASAFYPKKLYRQFYLFEPCNKGVPEPINWFMFDLNYSLSQSKFLNTLRMVAADFGKEVIRSSSAKEHHYYIKVV